MNKQQTEAIKSLEKAFKLCKLVKLEFVGCDCNLIVLPGGVIEKINRDCYNSRENPGVGEYANNPEAKHVNTHGCYIDSGGA